MDTDHDHLPLTAYGVLKSFFPAHDLHTVMKVATHAKQVVLQCNCGEGKLTITDKMVVVREWKLKDIKHALRNVPPMP